jgi:uncharacterized coiled-coil protein SlyX
MLFPKESPEKKGEIMENQQLNDRLDEFFRLLTVAANGITTLQNDVSEIKKTQEEHSQYLSGLKKEVAKNGQKLDTLTGQFSDVVNVVIKNDTSLTKLESEVAELQSNIH